jgi:hypothetical protein
MTINEAKQILKKSGYLVESENCILNITQDKCIELAPKIQEETGFFDNEDDCLDFLSDCIGYKQIGEVATEVYNYLSSVYGIDDDDIEADRADIEVLLKCIEDKFCFN